MSLAVQPRRLLGIALAILGLLGLAFVVGLVVGHRPLDLGRALSDPLSVERTILVEHRLPRVLLGAIVGAALSVSGAAFQALMKNPLADPFVLGASGGAALGGTIVICVGLGTLVLPGGLMVSTVPIAAFLGGLGALVLVMVLAGTPRGASPVDVLLVGVVMNFFASAVVMFLKTTVRAEKAQELLFWLMGTLDVERVTDLEIGLSAVLVGVGALALSALGQALNVLTLGDEAAAALGVDPRRVRRWVLVTTSVVVGAAVSVSGLIGFVGLVVPHVVRLVLGADHRVLLPASAVLGAVFLVLCDAVSRVLFSVFSGETPVGVVTAVIGGPVFVWLLRRTARDEAL